MKRFLIVPSLVLAVLLALCILNAVDVIARLSMIYCLVSWIMTSICVSFFSMFSSTTVLPV